MNWEWDQAKNAVNLEKHGLSFEDATAVFEGPYFQQVDDRRDYGEVRWRAFGVANGRVVVVVFTWRGQNRRIISARRASNEEREIYRRLLQP